MKKTTIVILVFLLKASFSQGQVLISLLLGDKLNSDKIEFGLDGGLVFTNLNGEPHANAKTSFNLGFYFDFKLKEKLFLHTGVIVKSPMGSEGLAPYSLGVPDLDQTLASGSVERKLRYYSVPVLIKYKFYNNFFIEAGPQLGLLNYAVDEFSATVKSKNDLLYKNDIEDQFKKIDAGVTVGLGCKLLNGKGINLGVRYYAGLTNVWKDSSIGAQQNSAFYVYTGIPIGIKSKSTSEK